MPTKTLLITSSYKLSQKELAVVVAQLGIAEEKELVTENEVDPALLGGLIIKYNGYYLDASLKGKLNDIVNSLD
jgi:F0F1-type ATP synthase delta subunit